MSAQSEEIQRYLNIKQAANVLKVTDKTIRNYIEKGVLDAEKWNGAWRIQYRNIIELYYKKYGKKLEYFDPEQLQKEPVISVSQEEYDSFQQRAGRLEYAEIQVKELRAELKILNERLGQLESSSASGWTEARKNKEDLDRLRDELKDARKSEKQALLETDWLRRELDRMRQIEKKQTEGLQTLHEQNREYAQNLKTCQEEIDRCHKEMKSLQAKYRRDSFLG